jgi:hypothetical protein
MDMRVLPLSLLDRSYSGVRASAIATAKGKEWMAQAMTVVEKTVLAMANQVDSFLSNFISLAYLRCLGTLPCDYSFRRSSSDGQTKPIRFPQETRS